MAAGPIPQRALPTLPQPNDEHAEANDLDFHFIKSQGEILGIGAQGKVTAEYDEQWGVGLSHLKLLHFSNKMIEVGCMQDDSIPAGEQTLERCRKRMRDLKKAKPQEYCEVSTLEDHPTVTNRI
jgi:hypothetical protein